MKARFKNPDGFTKPYGEVEVKNVGGFFRIQSGSEAGLYAPFSDMILIRGGITGYLDEDGIPVINLGSMELAFHAEDVEDVREQLDNAAKMADDLAALKPLDESMQV